MWGFILGITLPFAASSQEGDTLRLFADSTLRIPDVVLSWTPPRKVRPEEVNRVNAVHAAFSRQFTVKPFRDGDYGAKALTANTGKCQL
ncbi:MAG: hypothetical protein NVV59_08240, partial [Chitinophagaceae bacterium]|nr:hypothetical protein [Chitinophagaceae bacterium]